MEFEISPVFAVLERPLTVWYSRLVEATYVVPWRLGLTAGA
jgi:hypothetical protein